ncbi:hypothetical protein D3C73_979730 [compost metagenome]
MDQPDGRLIVRRADRQNQRLAVAYAADLRQRRLDDRAGIEDIDVAFVSEAFIGKDFHRRLGVGMGLADDCLGLFGEQTGVKWLAWHQLGDEGLAAQPRQVMGVVEVHFEEVPTQAVPEGRAALLIGSAAQLGDEFFTEQFGKFSHEQQTPQGQQPSIAALALIRAQEQRTDFRLAGHFVVQEQCRDLSLDTQVGGGTDCHPDPIVVPGFAQADGARQGADADDLLIVVLEHKQVVGVGAFDLSGEGPLCPAQAVGQAFLIGGQGGQAGYGLPSQCQQGGQVRDSSGADDHGAHPSIGCREHWASGRKALTGRSPAPGCRRSHSGQRTSRHPGRSGARRGSPGRRR